MKHDVGPILLVDRITVKIGDDTAFIGNRPILIELEILKQFKQFPPTVPKIREGHCC